MTLYSKYTRALTFQNLRQGPERDLLLLSPLRGHCCCCRRCWFRRHPGGGGEGGVGGPVARALCEDQDDTVIVSSCDVLRGTAEGEQTGDVSVLDKVFIVVIIIIIISFIYNLLS